MVQMQRFWIGHPTTPTASYLTASFLTVKETFVSKFYYILTLPSLNIRKIFAYKTTSFERMIFRENTFVYGVLVILMRLKSVSILNWFEIFNYSIVRVNLIEFVKLFGSIERYLE